MTRIDFEDRVAIVTGAGGGLGRSHALLLASRGARVVVNDVGTTVDGAGSSEDPAAKVAAEIEAAGGSAVADTSSVATPEGGRAVVEAALRAFGRIDIVVNNAGILADKSFANMTPELFDAVLDVHLRGAFFVTWPAWEKMREQGYGRIVSTSSSSGLYGNFGQANYSTAKMGLVGFTRTLAIEGARHGIKANAIAPVAATRMTEPLLGPLAAKLDPALVSPVVAWLASEGCPVTGEIYAAGGGRVAKVFVATTPGIYKADLTIEDVAEGFEAISAEEGYSTPRNAGEDTMLFLQLFPSDRGGG